MSKNGEFVWGPQMSLQHAQHKCRITSELGNLRRRPSKYNCFIFTQRHNTKQRWGGYLELTPMQRPWQDLLPLGPLRNTAAAICTEVGFCWGQERTEHWLHQCPFRPLACNTNLKNVHWELLWFLWRVVYQALHLLVLQSDSAAGWLIPLPGMRAGRGYIAASDLSILFPGQFPGRWLPDDSECVFSLLLSTHIETNVFISSLRGYFLFTICFNLYVNYKNQIK